MCPCYWHIVSINLSGDKLPAVYSDWPHLAKLFLGFVDLTYEVNEAISGLGNTLLRPISELELSDSSGLSILSIENQVKYMLSLMQSLTLSIPSNIELSVHFQITVQSMIISLKHDNKSEA